MMVRFSACFLFSSHRFRGEHISSLMSHLHYDSVVLVSFYRWENIDLGVVVITWLHVPEQEKESCVWHQRYQRWHFFSSVQYSALRHFSPHMWLKPSKCWFVHNLSDYRSGPPASEWQFKMAASPPCYSWEDRKLCSCSHQAFQLYFFTSFHKKEKEKRKMNPANLELSWKIFELWILH